MLAPLLGAIADAGNFKKRLLIVFSLLGISMTLGMDRNFKASLMEIAMLFTQQNEYDRQKSGLK